MTDQPGGGEHRSDATRPNVIRRLYDWILHWAETPYGVPALFVLALAEASFFPIPPDPLLIALCLGIPARSFRFAATVTLASVIGGVVGYSIGAGAWTLLQDWFFLYVPGVSPESFASVQGLYDRYDFWAIFLAGLTPLPYKVFTISAGVFSINIGVFILASFLSRGLRFFILAGLIYRYGDLITRFIDRYFNVLALAFGALVIGGFFILEVFLQATIISVDWVTVQVYIAAAIAQLQRKGTFVDGELVP